MTLRQTAVATAKFWGIQPHVIWRYPFRYFRELRDFYVTSVMGPPEEDDSDDRTISVEGDGEVIQTFDMDLIRGDAV